MRRFARRTNWSLAGLVFVALLAVQAGSPLAEAGRDFPRCIHSCNETRAACTDSCAVNCAELFPKGEERRACESSCDDICISNSQECKQICQNIKDPPSPEEP